MKKIKFFLLIISVLVLSGCTFEYNINIDENVISEENVVYIENTNSDSIEDTFEKMVSKYTGPTNSLGMYKSSVINNGNIFGISYKKNYSFDEYNDSVSFSSCYDSYKLVRDEDKLIIATSDEFKCFDLYEELDEVVINLKSSYHIEDSNADIVDGNKYTWHITRNNFKNKQISVMIDLSKMNDKKKIFDFNVFMLLTVFLILLGIIILLIRKRSKKVNKI